MYKSSAVIFDLDGTLIDSAPSILDCLRIIFINAGIEPAEPLNRALIGPPLREVLKKVIGVKQSVDIEFLAKEFTNSYDQQGFANSIPYPGVQNLLTSLRQRGISLYVATNKRYIPTRKIINFLGWSNLFFKVYCIDSDKTSPFQNKAAILRAIILENSIRSDEAVYVGDSLDDEGAALNNNIPFILASWGYGDFNNLESSNRVSATSAQDLYEKIIS